MSTLGDLERELMKRGASVAAIYRAEGKFRVSVIGSLEVGYGRGEELEAAVMQAFASFDEHVRDRLRAGPEGSSRPIAEARGANGPGFADIRPRPVSKHEGDCNVWCESGQCYEVS